MYAPKQKGNVKEQLKYIGRYIRRPAIALGRIEKYDGQFVTFKYMDKTDGKEKREKVTVEEFIGRLVRHIPDENFKTIRYYGVYSRRKKAECKQKVAIFQQTIKKQIVKVKKVLRKRNWSQRIKDQTGKDPMVCSKCQCYYEYKGSVCLQDGSLKIKYAKCEYSRAYLERMIAYFTGIETTQKREEKKEAYRPPQPIQETERQLCLFNVS